MEGCIDCNNKCLEELSDQCILYSGPDYTFLNIESGEYYNTVIVELIEKLEELYEGPSNLSCITDKKDLNSSQAVEEIVNKICTLNSSDITYDGEKYCIGDDTISSSAILMLGTKFRYSVSVSDTGSNVSYDLSDIERSLPKNYRLSRVNAVISGKPKNGRSIIADTSNVFTGVKVDNSRFPVNIDVDVRVSGPNGDVRLSKSITIPSPKTDEYFSELIVKDFGANSQQDFTVSKFNELLALQVCDNKTRIDQLLNLDIKGCDGLDYGGNDLKTIIATQGAVICSLLNRVQALENTSNQNCIEGC